MGKLTFVGNCSFDEAPSDEECYNREVLTELANLVVKYVYDDAHNYAPMERACRGLASVLEDCTDGQYDSDCEDNEKAIIESVAIRMANVKVARAYLEGLGYTVGGSDE